MNKKVIAIAAALAVVLTSMAVAVPSMQSTDAAFSSVTAAPVAYGEGNGVRAILYQDKVLMIDISEVATLNKDDFYKVKVSTGSTYSESNGICVCPVNSVNGIIVINVDGKSIDRTTSLISTTVSKPGNMYVEVKNMNGGTVGTQITLTYKVTENGLSAMVLNLYKNNDDGWDSEKIGGATGNVVSNVTLQNRGIMYNLDKDQKTIQDMTASVDTSVESNSNHTLIDPNKKLKLIGWSKTPQKVNGTVEVNAEKMTVEDLIYQVYNTGVNTNSNTINLYAVYAAIEYRAFIQDHSERISESWTTTGAKIQGNTTLSEGLDVIATASVTPEISSIEYGILSIELINKANNTNNYVFTVKAYKEIDSDGNVKDDTLVGDDIFTAVSANVYKISNVTSDLYIKIALKSITMDTGNLYFDSVKNVQVEDGLSKVIHGEANLSLDLFHTTTLDSGSILKMDGTIYKTSLDGIRTYSSLDNYITLESKKDSPISVKMDGDLINVAEKEEDDYQDGRLDNITLTLYIKDSLSKADSYDMSLKLDSGYSIYALQGIWKDSSNNEIEHTPWALADN